LQLSKELVLFVKNYPGINLALGRGAADALISAFCFKASSSFVGTLLCSRTALSRHGCGVLVVGGWWKRKKALKNDCRITG
jgi:hypothetical protein